MRIAFVAPDLGHGGVPGVGLTIATGLAERGHVVDTYSMRDRSKAPDLTVVDGLHHRSFDTGMRWNRWYSRTKRPLATQLAVFGSRVHATREMAAEVAAANASTPYDVVYRFSTIELLSLARHVGALPPVVVHPEVHAAGELMWSRRERPLARRTMRWHRRAGAEALLAYRASRQRRDITRVAAVIAPSEAFATALRADYPVGDTPVTIVPNPIDLDRFRPPVGPADDRTEGEPRRVVWIGRAAVRKGVEQVVDLAYRLRGDHDVRVEAVADHSRWSDYRPLLADVPPEVLTVHSPMRQDQLADFVRRVDVLVQPSHYEPFGLTAAEALASGVPVVATTAVGASEGIDQRCCIRIPPGSVDDLERGVREMLGRLDDDGTTVRAVARDEAIRCFGSAEVAAAVEAALEGLVWSTRTC